MKDVLKYIWGWMKEAFASMWRFAKWMTLIFVVLSYGLVVLWHYDLLGDECRYYGDYVRKCYLFGVNIDGFTELFLTPWIMPFFGLIAGVLSPFIYAYTMTIMIWPFYYGAKMLWRAIRKLFGKKNDKQSSE